MMRTCFLFGNAITPESALVDIEAAAEGYYLQLGVHNFVVGSRGSFDRFAAAAIKKLKRQYNDITLQLLLAYHPGECPVSIPEGFDGSYFPPLERVPRQFAIVQANQFMIDHADAIICYVAYPGNSRGLLEYARKRTAVSIKNIAEN